MKHSCILYGGNEVVNKLVFVRKDELMKWRDFRQEEVSMCSLKLFHKLPVRTGEACATRLTDLKIEQTTDLLS